MVFKRRIPTDELKPYIMYFWWMDSEVAEDVSDRLLPSGCVEIVFNLGEASWQSQHNGVFKTDPEIELIGQITRPSAVRAKGRNMMLGIRFYPHAASLFIEGGLRELTNRVSDLTAVFGHNVSVLRTRLLEETDLLTKVHLLEIFLIEKLRRAGPKLRRFTLIDSMIRSGGMEDIHDIGHVASQCGISPRYLQKLFLEFLGITPKTFLKIKRFKRSFYYLNHNPPSLTTVAFDSGYFDQSHFIRDFKSFTGLTPSQYVPGTFPASELFFRK